MSGLSTRQHYSEIQDMILSVTKSEKIKYSWKRSPSVFNMMGITFHYTAIHQKQKTKTKNKTLVSSTSIYFQLNHCWTDWNGPSSMKWCSKNVQMYALAFFHEKKTTLIHVCIHIVCNANGHKCAFIYTREMLIYHSWKKKKNTKMPKIVEVGLHCGHARYFAER